VPLKQRRRMERAWVVWALCLVAVAQCHQGETGQLEPDDFAESMSAHFGHLAAHRNPRPLYGDNWRKAREYIKEAFIEMGLETELQCFNSTVEMVSPDGATTVTTVAEGCNVVGVSGGAKSGNTIVLGAHYDTQDHGVVNTPLARNGAGVATLLEVAKAYQESVQDEHYYRNYTTVFVAFDLNNIEEPTPSKGYSGVSNFVTGWLEPRLPSSPLKGAVILDSIASYSSEANSQNLTSDFKQIFPEAYVRINEEDRKGDFLAAVTTEDGQDFLKAFVGSYRRDRMARPFRLQELVTAGQSFGYGETFEAMTSYEAAPFWEHTPTLPALLLTDTRGMRDLPASDVVCEQTCPEEWATPQRMEFLYHTYASLLRLLLEEQTTEYSGSGVSGTSASGLALVGCMLLGRLLYHQ